MIFFVNPSDTTHCERTFIKKLFNSSKKSDIILTCKVNVRLIRFNVFEKV